MIATGVAILVLVLAFELWLPLAFIFGAIKLVATLSIEAAWQAFVGVPGWIWDFVHSSLA